MNSFDNNQAAKLRNAIQSTTSALAVLTASSSLQTVLQTHLAGLLVRERALFGCDTEATPVAKDTPWCPDDSGKWVEVPPGTRALPPGLDPNCLSEVLTTTERRTETYIIGQAYPSKGWSWHGGHIVAYKVVEPAAKDTPWYPDDSGKWIEVPPGSGFPKGLDFGTTVEVLARGERIAKSYKYWARPAGSWYWLHEGDSTIVAYKIVE